MLEYVYIVKCPNCEDEHFYFFDEAKNCAMGQLTKKPIITQVEVNRNDFGECTDSCDLGTVWSWEEMMKDVQSAPEQVAFTKAATVDCDDDFFNQEFDELDNSLDVPAVKKPVPAGMTIDDLVEAMEANEDEVECKSCGELANKSDCRATDCGWVCSTCTGLNEFYGRDPFDHHDPDYDEEEAADALADMIDGAKDARYDRALDSLDESTDSSELVELEYPELTVTLYGPQRDVDDWDEVEHTTSHVFLVPKVEVATAVWENWITEEDVVDVEGGLETLEDDTAWEKYLETHFDDLFEKYHQQILDYFKDEAVEDFRERSQEEHDLERWAGKSKIHNWNEDDDSWDAVEESVSQKPFLEEFDEAETHKARLTDCPECGATSYDMKEQYCTNCGLNL